MNQRYKVLIIEDEQAIRAFIAATLKADGYHVIQADTAAKGEALIRSGCPDVVLLDLGLPDMDGADLLRRLRENSDIPVLVVSARGHEQEKVAALDLGADDYIVKPFGTQELLARIRTAMRHNIRLRFGEPVGIYAADDLTIDFDRRQVRVGDREIHLTQVEYRIVSLLCRHAGHVLTHDFLLRNVWGPNAPHDIQILRVNMANIRRKLEVNPAEPRYIVTEIGVGYRMIEGK
jgi:two-component system KDP operon response regulator KdpE